MDYKRFFSFGCSFTRWNWPTWADIIGHQSPEFSNWGKHSHGNQFIASSVAECNQRYKFDKNDLVIVMWSEYSREDRYINGEWKSNSLIFRHYEYPKLSNDSPLRKFEKEYMMTMTDDRGSIVRDASSMALVKNLLDSSGCKYIFLSMTPMTDTTVPKDIVDCYSDVYSIIRPSVFEVIFNSEWRISKDEYTVDTHPLPIEHLRYLQIVCPEIEISDETVDWTHTVNNKLLAIVGNSHGQPILGYKSTETYNYFGYDKTWPLRL